MTLILKNDLKGMLVHIDDTFHLLCVFRIFLFFASLEEAILIFCGLYFLNYLFQ